MMYICYYDDNTKEFWTDSELRKRWSEIKDDEFLTSCDITTYQQFIDNQIYFGPLQRFTVELVCFESECFNVIEMLESMGYNCIDVIEQVLLDSYMFEGNFTAIYCQSCYLNSNQSYYKVWIANKGEHGEKAYDYVINKYKEDLKASQGAY